MQETTIRTMEKETKELGFRPNKFYITGQVSNRRHLGNVVWGVFNDYRVCLRYNSESLDDKLVKEDIRLIENKKNPVHCDIIDLYVEDRPIILFKTGNKLDMSALDKELNREINQGLYV
jgi:hypothetical protein